MKKIFSLTALCIFSFCASISLFGEVKSSSLNGTWTLTYWEQPLEAIRDPNKIPASAKKIDAQVPSNVELDLLRAGLIEDPKIGSNTYSLRKFEGYQWLFEREFDAPPLAEGQRAILRLEGVDTFADVFVNGAKAGELENMLVAHKADITKFLKFGKKNSLQILIRSSVLEAQEYFTGAISNAYELENIRKAPHMAGWDILPRIVGAGIWRGVFIDVENPARILDAHFMTNELDPKNSRAKFSVFVQSKIPAPLIGKAKISLKISRNGEKIFEKTEALNTPKYKLTRAKIEGVEPWWPRGYGEASLYDLKVDLLMPNGKIIDSVSKKIGF